MLKEMLASEIWLSNAGNTKLGKVGSSWQTFYIEWRGLNLIFLHVQCGDVFKFYIIRERQK